MGSRKNFQMYNFIWNLYKVKISRQPGGDRVFSWRSRRAQCVHTIFPYWWKCSDDLKDSVRALFNAVVYNESILRLCVSRANGDLVAVWDLTALLCRPNFLSIASMFIRTKSRAAYFMHVVAHGVLGDPTATNEDAATLLRRCRNHNVILRVCFHFALTV